MIQMQNSKVKMQSLGVRVKHFDSYMLHFEFSMKGGENR